METAQVVPITERLRAIKIGSYTVDNGSHSKHFAVRTVCESAADEIERNHEREKQLYGECLLLADVLRDAYEVVKTVEGEEQDECDKLTELCFSIAHALALYDEMKLIEREPTPEIQQEPVCKTHPDTPHGFDRNASHNEGRYVCECESWEPYAQAEIAKRDARIAELEQDLQTTADALGHAHRDIERLERESSACDLLEEQKGTIKALNWALGGEEKNEYARMIACTLNDYAKQAAQIEELAAQNQQLREALEFDGFIPTDAQHMELQIRALALPDLASPVLNRVKAEEPRIDLGRYAGTYGGYITDAIEKGEKG